jgi:hypothetical protein
MMEISLFPLNSVSDTWQNSSTTTWAMGMILAFVCGLGLFFLLMPCLKSNPLSPSAGKKKTPRQVRNLHARPNKQEICLFVLFSLFQVT